MRRFTAFVLAAVVIGGASLATPVRPVSAVQPCWSQAQVDTTNDNHGDLGGPDLLFAGLQLDCAQLTWRPSFAFAGSSLPAVNTTATIFVDTDSNTATGCTGADLILDLQFGAGGTVQSILGRHAASCSAITTLGRRRIDTFPEGWIGSPTFDWQLNAQGDLMPNQGWYHVADGVPHEGSPLFTISPVSIHRFYELIVSGDFNGDGVDDVLFHAYPPQHTDPLWLGQLGGGFTRVSLNVPGLWARIVVGDFNGDGVDDLLFFAQYGAGSVQPLWLGQHGGGFVHTSVAVRVCNAFVAVGDFNGDGVDDLFCYDGAHHGTLSYLHANAQPDTRAFTFAGAYGTIAAGDFDGDGRADILFRSWAKDVNYVWYGNANETFTSKAMALHTAAANVVDGDFDGDGRSDLILWRAGVGPDVLRLGTAARAFGSGPQVRIDYSYWWVVPGDYDGNGKSDLLAVGNAWVLPTLWTAN